MDQIKNGMPIELFTTAEQWHSWLVAHNKDSGVWLRFYKKGQGESITHDIALDEALCFGWIDSQAASYDTSSYLQKFTPRRPKSIWSKRNIEHIERLTSEGRMAPQGQAEVEAAKADGRWQQAYDSPANMEIPQDFLDKLAQNPEAGTFFETLNKTNRYSITWRLQTAKTAVTRERRMNTIMTMLTNHEKFH
jgi:uncharacterized protein YdeI (YjbR/CyaY-like superfamily)